jgi:hypothetical protein
VRRLLAWAAGVAAGIGLLGLLSRRRRAAVPADESPAPDPRADELRRRLAEARETVDEQESWSSGEVPIDEAEPAAVDPDERRRRVHAQGRSAAERMRRPVE